MNTIEQHVLHNSEILPEGLSLEEFDVESYFSGVTTDHFQRNLNPLEMDDTQKKWWKKILRVKDTKKKTETFVQKLQSEAAESVTILNNKVTQETFRQGFHISSSILNTLGSLGSACGPICAHSVSALAESVGGLHNLAGVSLPGFKTDSAGNFSFTGTANDLAGVTGFSKADLLSGKYTQADIVHILFESIGAGMSGICFGLIRCLIDGCIPTPVTLQQST